MCAMNRVHSVPRDSPRKVTSKISKSGHPSSPWTALEIQETISNTKSASASSFHHQAAALNQPQLPASTTRQHHQISISFQPPQPGSSTNSASASSLHHQAAAPHQPASSKASSQSAVNSTTLPHPHHGSQVYCCLDILWLYSSIVF